MDDRQYIYQAEGGVQAAVAFMEDALRHPGFPDKFKPRVAALAQRALRAFAPIRVHADAARGRRARVDATAEPLKMLRMAEQGLANAVDGLQEAVDRGAGQYRVLIRTIQMLRDDVVEVIRDVEAYSEFDEAWAALRGGVSDAVRGVDEWLLGRRPPAARPALVAHWNAAGAGHGGLVHTAGSGATVEDVVRAQVGDLLLLQEDDFHGATYGWKRVGERKTDWVRVFQNGSEWVPVADRPRPGEEFLRITRLLGQGRRMTLSRPRMARGKAKKDVGHGGLDEWFSGHGGGKGEATWGDWVAISPVKKKVERELADGTVKEKTVQPGDIVGPCGVSDDPEWKDVTRGGQDPLKCMPRQKAHDMPRKERADLAREKMRAERDDGDRGKGTTHTRTFEKEASDAVMAGDNEPTKPDLWEKAKDKARERYTKWPSAYAVGHALKIYKDEGGGWRKKAARPIRIDRAEVQRVAGLALAEFGKLLRDVPDEASFARVYRRAYYEGPRPFTQFDAVDVRGRPVRVSMYIGLQGIPRGAVVAGVSGDKRDMFILANSLMPKAELLNALRKEMLALVAHEITHLIDVLPDMKEVDPVIRTEDAARAYFNRLPEVRGWMRHIYEDIREEVHRAQAAGVNLGRAITDALTRSPRWHDASPYLSPKNRKTVLKGLVTAFEDDAVDGHGTRTAGWWRSDTGVLLGDGPADVMQDAVDEIRDIYRGHPEISREPTLEEVWGVLSFVTGPARDRGGFA